MRFRLVSSLALVMLALSFLGLSTVWSKILGDSRPPQFTPGPTPYGTITPAPTPPPWSPTPAPNKSAKGNPQFMPVSLFGMNLYLTGLERSDSEAQLLGSM